MCVVRAQVAHWNPMIRDNADDLLVQFLLFFLVYRQETQRKGQSMRRRLDPRKGQSFEVRRTAHLMTSNQKDEYVPYQT